MSKSRIYLVKHRIGETIESRLVDAPSQSQAIARVVKTNVACGVASQEALVTHVSAGVKVEKAGAV